MTDESRRILDLLAQGKLTVDEADQLLRAVSASTTANDSATASAPSSGTASASSAGTKQESKSGESEPSPPRYIRIAVKRTRPSWTNPKEAKEAAKEA
jgi:hypothetical protein